MFNHHLSIVLIIIKNSIIQHTYVFTDLIRRVVNEFSEILCVDEVYQDRLALLLAVDPTAPDGDRGGRLPVSPWHGRHDRRGAVSHPLSQCGCGSASSDSAMAPGGSSPAIRPCLCSGYLSFFLKNSWQNALRNYITFSLKLTLKYSINFSIWTFLQDTCK